MKKFFLLSSLLLAFVSSTIAQNVIIPNANFKAKLIALGVDTNGDGEIQVAEAQAITSLDVSSSSITNMIGIEAFTNLITLICDNNQLTSLNITNNTNLQVLDCSFNYITNLNISNNINLLSLVCNNNHLYDLDVSNNLSLQELNCYGMPLSTLDVSNNLNLTSLLCTSNQLTSLDVSNNINLTYLNCTSNLLTSLDVSENINLTDLLCSYNPLTNLNTSNNIQLQRLSCYYNQLPSLDVSDNVNLIELACWNNQLTSLDVSNNIQLQKLSCYYNPLTNLTIDGAVNLTHLYCHNTQLSSVDVSDNISLITLECYDNPLTSIDMFNAINLAYLDCHNAQLTNLDVSNCISLLELNCNNNSLPSLDVSNCIHLTNLWGQDNQFTYINIKNGSILSTFDFSNNPNLQYICVDSIEISNIIALTQQYGMTNIVFNMFCTYAPGGNYNTVSGQAFTDFDLNTCTNTDPIYPFIPILVKNGTTSLDYVFTNQSGNYLTYVDSGSYSLTPQPFYPVYFIGNVSNVAFSNNNNNTANLDVCIVPNGTFPDVEITLIPINTGLPGFDATFDIQYKNIGNTIADGVITYDFPSSQMSFESTNTTPATQTTNQITWAYSNLFPLEVRTIQFTMNVFAPPINEIGDTVHSVVNISLINDLNPSDNVAMINQILFGAYDPNDKTCLEGGLLNNSKIGEYLHYMVRFQNTGNYPAENVVIVDTLDDTKYDLQSLQIIETSHPCHIDLRGKVLQFYFENIQLADSFSNEPESHGYVVFKLKTKNTLPLNSSVSNKAEIYFDFNPPIITNVATTVFTNTVSIHPETQLAFRCYPNPAQNTLTIEVQTPQTLTILNAIGKVMQEISVSDKQEIDISAFAPGMYYLKSEHAGVSFVKE